MSPPHIKTGTTEAIQNGKPQPVSRQHHQKRSHLPYSWGASQQWARQVCSQSNSQEDPGPRASPGKCFKLLQAKPLPGSSKRLDLQT